jgi:signal transduction histidine kinase
MRYCRTRTPSWRAPCRYRGGEGQPREVGFPLQHEPRVAHAAQRDPRLRPADGIRHAAAHALQKRSIDQILKAGWYLLELINEILDLAVIESGKLSLSAEPVSLIEVMLECQAMIEPQAQKRGISVSFPDFEPCFVQADRTRVKQVLINLLSNAIKYNRPAAR